MYGREHVRPSEVPVPGLPRHDPLASSGMAGRRRSRLMLGWVLGILLWLFIAVLCAVMLLGMWTIVRKLVQRLRR